nr:hypothetical protein [Tanacetum cinerariifolium]
MPIATRFGMTQDVIDEFIAKRVEEALKTYDASRNPEPEVESEDEQGDDNVYDNGNGNGNGQGRGNGNINPNVNGEGIVPNAHEIRRWCYNLTPAESKFKTSMLDHQDKYMMKAQVHVSKSSAISDEQPLPGRKYHCQHDKSIK